MIKPSEREILAALRETPSAGTVAKLLATDLRRVILVQQRHKIDQNPHPQRHRELEDELNDHHRDPDGPHPMAKKLKSPQGRYWREVRMVPDDRADEQIDFDKYFEAHVEAIAGEAQRSGGRGAA